MKELEQRIKLLWLLSAEMLELACDGDWDAVSERETQRRVLLNELFEQPPPENLAPQVDEAIRATLDSDSQLLELARREMDRLGGALKSFSQRRRTRQAYQIP